MTAFPQIVADCVHDSERVVLKQIYILYWETFQKSVLRYRLRFNTKNKYNSMRHREGKKSKEMIPDYGFTKYI